MSADGKTLIGYDVDLLNDLQELLGFEIDGGLQAMDYSTPLIIILYVDLQLF